MKDFLSSFEDALRDGMTDKAIQMCVHRLKANPKDWSATVCLAKAYFEKGMLREAREELEKLAKVMSNNRMIYKMLGEIYEKEGNRGKAITFYRIFSAYDPGDSEVNYILSSLEVEEHLRRERMPREDRSGVLEGESDDKVKILTNTVAEIYIKQGHLDKALETYREMLGADPANAAIQRKIEDLIEKIKESGRTEVDLPLYSPKTERIITTLNNWLGNLQRVKERPRSVQ
ncbi:MAG: hypothetical protein ABID54_14825 [Pseudomonadota bacterium]